MAPTDAEQLASAKKARAGAAGWLTRACKACEQLVGIALNVVDVVDYESALTNFSNRLRAWDEAEEKVELLLEEEHLEAEIDSAADYREKAEKSKNSLISAWSRAHPVIEAEGS